MTNAQVVAEQFGSFPTLNPEIEAEIARLSKQPYLELEQVKQCHSWMYELTLSRMTGLLVGESRCGKTVTCKSFAARYNKSKRGNKELNRLFTFKFRKIVVLGSFSLRYLRL